ncbi:DegT/DnrJ/EryC1/StrS family aminotransferase [Endozoicomonas sp. Mp262]|uniref:DegT/DnrJ/EryC1/StrS family aminotransferase n=1 Tax=Endozoicomonas sp. Mp262 TaxID=2919499 RepID=UPI0021D81381
MTRPIPMVDMTRWHTEIQKELESTALKVLRSGRFILGSELEAFEHEAARYLGSEFAIGCASGTDALILALKAAGIQPGDEVITTPFTFFATAEAIVQVGANPVFIDIDSKSYNLDPQQITSAITPKTRAVLIVHLFGCPAKIDAIVSICKTHNLILLEDCAQSFGAAFANQKTGTFGLAGCYSFFPSKNLGGFGDGGLVVTDCPKVAERLLELRNHGSLRQYHHKTIGYNSRLDELQAALLRVKLRYIDAYNKSRRQVAKWYGEYLNNTRLCLPEEPADNCHHVFNQYTVLAENRDTLKKHLETQGIASSVFYPVPLYHQPSLSHCQSVINWDDRTPETEKVSRKCLSLPIYPYIPQEHIAYIASVLESSR